MKKVEVNEEKVLDLWSKGYNDKQVRVSLGLSVSTWDRWKKAYKQRNMKNVEVTKEQVQVQKKTTYEGEMILNRKLSKLEVKMGQFVVKVTSGLDEVLSEILSRVRYENEYFSKLLKLGK